MQFFMRCVIFTEIVLVRLSSSLMSPKTSSRVKQIAVVNQLGINCLTKVPINSDKPRIAVQMRLMICADKKGILILLLP